MTTLLTVSVPTSQIKVRWREPYVSEGVNKALAVLDPGIYRGGYLKATATASTSIRITADGEQDTHFLWVDKTTGTALAIRYSADILLDMSARFSGGGGTLPSTQTWYVWLDCAYSAGSTTTATFYVGDAAPASANAVKLGRLTVTSGATVIADTTINRSTTYRTVAHVDRPLLLAKSVTKAVTTNKFQITGKVYLPSGSLNFGSRDYYINLMGATGLSRTAYIGDDGALIWVKNVWTDTGLSVAIDSDSEGFIQDPWVELDVSQTSDTSPPMCHVRYWTRGTLRDLVLDDQIKADWLPHDHAAFVTAREKAGSPTSLTLGTVQSQIEELLDAVNARIPEVTPETAPASPVLLWRSHGITLDANVTGTTISAYWGTNLGFAIIVGGYISGANAVRALVSPAQTMVMLRLHGALEAGPELLSSRVADGATVPWNTPGSWASSLHTVDLGGVPMLAANALATTILTTVATVFGGIGTLNNQDAYFAGNTPGASGRDTYCRLWEGSGSNVLSRLYYGNGSFWFTMNAWWDQSLDGGSGRWTEDHSTTHAMAVGLFLDSSDVKFGIFRKNYGSFGAGWTTWDSSLDWGDANAITADMYAYPKMTGDIEDEVHFAIGATKAGTDQVYGCDGVTWHGRFASTPSGTTVTAVASVAWATGSGAFVTVNSASTLGARVVGVSDTTSHSGLAYYHGTVRPYD